MPGRVAGRSVRASAAESPRKSTASGTRARGSASARTSAPAVEVPDEGVATSLRIQICQVFADAQRNTATQRKLAVNLRKIQEACCYEPINPKKKSKVGEEFGEQEFNEEVGRCVIRVLPVKKSEPVGDRVVRFITLFLKHASDKDQALHQSEDVETAEAFTETPSSRLTSHILGMVLQGLTAKDKTVRFRATQIIAQIINTADSIDDELFQLLRLGLLKRLRDKESAVRVQAILGLGRLADEAEDDNEDDESDDGLAGGVLEKLLDVLQNDPSAEVRRTLLLNLPFTPGTLPYLLERARDLDGATRRALYARLLPALGDFRHLSLTHREKLLRWGLRDRDETVRKATARLFRERWIEDCAGPAPTAEDGTPAQPGAVAPPTLTALLELLERIDIVNAGVETGVGKEAMKEFWDGRPDYRDHVTFDDDFWSNLTPESAFAVRTFNDYCRQGKDSRLQDLVDDKMPEVTKFAFFLQNHLNMLIEDVQKVALNEDPEVEEDTVQQEFCVEQMLHIALTLDYTDEIGRRKMFSIMREALALAELPEECTKLVVEVLRTVCGSNVAGEREFCGIVLEAVAEVHDTIMGEDASEKGADDSFHSARSELSDESTPTKSGNKKGQDKDEPSEIDEEKAIREIMVNMKCLHIAQCMLQNVQCDLEQNSHLVTMLNNLVVPAVRSQEAPIRERGLMCLGLCCLLSKNLAEENLTLFLHCFGKGHEALQQIALQIITDVLINHPSLLAPPSPSEGEPQSPTKGGPVNPLLKPTAKAFLRALGLPAPSTLPLNAAIGLSKLLLLHIFPAATASDLLKSLILSYFSPDTAEDPGLRQALNYFLPVYCHSRLSNAVQVARVLVSAMGKLMLAVEDADEEEDEFVGWTTIVGMLAEWTDGRRVVDTGSVRNIKSGEEEEEEPHVVLAIEVLERVVSSGCSKEERKPLLSLLSKLHIPANASTSPTGSPSAAYVSALQILNELTEKALDSRVAPDATTRTALTRLQSSLSKILGDAEIVIPSVEDEASDATEVGKAAPAEVKAEEEEPATEIPADDTEVPDTTEAPVEVSEVTTATLDEDTEMMDAPPPDDTVLDAPEGAETIFGALPEAEGTIIPVSAPIVAPVAAPVVAPVVAPKRRGRPSRLAAAKARQSEDSIVESLLNSEI